MSDGAEREPYRRPQLEPEKFYAGVDAARDAIEKARKKKGAKKDAKR